ncbi:hypothetical protein BSKO_06183 [Bryopsis sp. KO-2023]|nr:hypothetical protein BSKO_06183 [Bryopsis sp. KO-2023]
MELLLVAVAILDSLAALPPALNLLRRPVADPQEELAALGKNVETILLDSLCQVMFGGNLHFWRDKGGPPVVVVVDKGAKRSILDLFNVGMLLVKANHAFAIAEPLIDLLAQPSEVLPQPAKASELPTQPSKMGRAPKIQGTKVKDIKGWLDDVKEVKTDKESRKDDRWPNTSSIRFLTKLINDFHPHETFEEGGITFRRLASERGISNGMISVRGVVGNRTQFNLSFSVLKRRVSYRRKHNRRNVMEHATGKLSSSIRTPFPDNDHWFTTNTQWTAVVDQMAQDYEEYGTLCRDTPILEPSQPEGPEDILAGKMPAAGPAPSHEAPNLGLPFGASLG